MSKTAALRQIMKERGTNQVGLAKSTGLSTWTINAACKGLMSKATIDAIAEKFQIDPKQLGEPTLGNKPTGKIPPPLPSKKLLSTSAAQPAKLEEPKQEEIPPAPEPKTDVFQSILSIVAAEITPEEGDALAAALFKTRKYKGFTESEFAMVESWAEKIKADYDSLGRVLNGKANIDIQNGNVKIVEETPPPLKSVMAALASPGNGAASNPAPDSSNKLMELIEAHLAWGRSQHAWQDYYIDEKRNSMKYWIKSIGLKSISDISLTKFDQVIKDQFKAGKSRQTVEKYAKHLAAFYSWAADKAFISADILAGKSSAGNLRGLAKQVGVKW